MSSLHHRPPTAASVVVVLALAVMGGCTGSDDTSNDPEPATSAASSSTGSATVLTGDSTADPTDDSATQRSDTVTLVTYESFPTEGTRINELLSEFGDDNGLDVEILIAGDTGTMLSKAELTAGNPEGDVMWGIDSTFISRAIDAGVFEPYEADGAETLAAGLTDLVPGSEATPVDRGDVCVNYDIAALDDLGLEPPASLADLTDAAYADLLVVQNPATSSPGLAFLLATVDEYGEDGWQEYWSELVDNGVQVVDGWTEAYYEQFSYAGGERPLVVSYGSSPPFEVLFAETELDAAPTGVVESTCYRQVEFAGVLAGTERPDAARRLIDFMISPEFQEALPQNVFVFPASSDADLDPVFEEYAVIPDDSREIDPATVDANREAWIDEWTDIVIG